MVRNLKMWLSLILLVAIVAGVAVVIAETTGMRARWEAQRLEAQAAVMDIQRQREAQIPLVVAALADTAMAVIGAVIDKLLLIALVIYLLIRQEGGQDAQEIQ